MTRKSRLSIKKSLKLKARTKINIKFYARLIGGYFTFFAVIFGIGLLFGKLLETTFIVIGYFTTRFLMPKIKHFNTTAKCIFVTSMTFLFGIAIVCIPKNTSIIWNVGVGAVIPLIMYTESLLFDVKITDKDKLIALCKSHNYNELKTQMAVKFFIEKEKPREVWLWLCETQNNPIDWDSVKKIKYRMKKELFESEK